MSTFTFGILNYFCDFIDKSIFIIVIIFHQFESQIY